MSYSVKAGIALVLSILLAAGMYVLFTVLSISNNMLHSDNAQKLVQATDVKGDDEDNLDIPDTLPDDFYVLLLGVDSDENRSVGNDAWMFENVFRSDSIILAHVDTKKQKISLCSFHRDLITQIDGYDGYDKLNSAYALGGQPLMKKEIKQLTGIDSIPYYAIVDMDGMRAIIDSLGGIEVNVEDSFYDTEIEQGLDEKGVQILDGEKALIYARSRHAWDEKGQVGDTARARHQREVLQAMAVKFSEQDLLGLLHSAETVSHYVSTNLDLEQMFEIAGKLQGFDAEENIYSYMTPTGGLYMDETWFEVLQEKKWGKILSDFIANDGPKRSKGIEDEMEDVPTTEQFIARYGVNGYDYSASDRGYTDNDHDGYDDYTGVYFGGNANSNGNSNNSNSSNSSGNYNDDDYTNSSNDDSGYDGWEDDSGDSSTYYSGDFPDEDGDGIPDDNDGDGIPDEY